MSDFEIMIDFFKQKTAYDEIVIGCFLSNYGDKNICSGFRSCGCKDLKKCEAMSHVERGKQNV